MGQVSQASTSQTHSLLASATFSIVISIIALLLQFCPLPKYYHLTTKSSWGTEEHKASLICSNTRCLPCRIRKSILIPRQRKQKVCRLGNSLGQSVEIPTTIFCIRRQIVNWSQENIFRIVWFTTLKAYL
jgi:hypothetical protein